MNNFRKICFPTLVRSIFSFNTVVVIQTDVRSLGKIFVSRTHMSPSQQSLQCALRLTLPFIVWISIEMSYTFALEIIDFKILSLHHLYTSYYILSTNSLLLYKNLSIYQVLIIQILHSKLEYHYITAPTWKTSSLIYFLY